MNFVICIFLPNAILKLSQSVRGQFVTFIDVGMHPGWDGTFYDAY